MKTRLLTTLCLVVMVHNTAFGGMRPYPYLTILLSAAPQADRAVGIVRSGGGGMCSFVCVTPDGLCLTAEHCGRTAGKAELNGKTYSTEIVYLPPLNKRDEAVLFRLAGRGPFPFAPIARLPPARGDRVWTIGFPSGKRVKKSGLITSVGGGGFTADATITSMPIRPGHSGGPLFNTRGEVIGLASVSDFTTMAGWIGHSSIVRTMSHARPVQANRQPELVVFTQPNCPPCEAFKHDAAQGYFPGWKITIVTWSGKAFSNPELWAEFKKATGRSGGLKTPTFWVRGTNRVKEGYAGGRRGGLFQWLKGLFEFGVHAMFGKPDKPTPIPPTPELGESGPQPYKRKSAGTELRADVDEALRLGKDIKARVDSLREGGLLFSKIRNGLALKSDVKELKTVAADAKSHAAEFRDGLHDPRALFGLIVGAVQLWRRRKEVAA